MSEHLVVDPKDSDEELAEDLLDDIAALLARKHCLLKHAPDCMVLAVDNPAESNYRAIAQISIIAPSQVVWRPVKWRPLRKAN